MTPNDDLARWGEPPAERDELELAELLAGYVDRAAAPPALRDLLRVDARVRELEQTIASRCALPGNPATPADPGGAWSGPRLCVALHRDVGGRFVPLAATSPRAALRDLRRVPDDAERVTLRTGDRVRIEVDCDRDGHLTVFNVGPRGAVNLLWPDDLERPAVRRAGEVLRVADVEVTPPAGAERVYAVWSAVPLSWGGVERLAGPTVAVRDMARVQTAVESLRPEQWHAVVLEVWHEG